jgi:glyoxylase-like metal-dependent hydrolase (beta-lactamase superfamily II)
MNIVNVGYDSTNYYVLQAGKTRLLVDVGMQGTLPKLLANLKRKDIALEQIDYLLVTHNHPDHAGIVADVMAQGLRLLALENQAIVPAESATTQRGRGSNASVTLRLADSRHFLQSLGFAGQIIGTPGHSEDSVSLVLDSGEAFTGDLPPPGMTTGDAETQVRESWAAIKRLGGRMVYAGHGPVRPLTW